MNVDKPLVSTAELIKMDDFNILNKITRKKNFEFSTFAV